MRKRRLRGLGTLRWQGRDSGAPLRLRLRAAGSPGDSLQAFPSQSVVCDEAQMLCGWRHYLIICLVPLAWAINKELLSFHQE